MKRGGPLRRTRGLARTTKRLRAVAKRKAPAHRAALRWRREFLKRNPICQMWVFAMTPDKLWEDAAILHAWMIRNPCQGLSCDVHEIVKRSRGGDTTDEKNCVALCRMCHDFTEEYPAVATRIGLLASNTKRRD